MMTSRTFKTPRRSLHRPLPSAPQTAAAAMPCGAQVMGHVPEHGLPIVPERADGRTTVTSLIFPPAALPGNHEDAYRTPCRAGSHIG